MGVIFSDKQYLLFDLDGTLTDPKEGITKSVQYALQKYGISVPNLDELIPFIGPPLKDSFMDFYGFCEADALQAVEFYRERFADTGIYENRLYPGIPELLKALQADGRHLLLATSKPEIFAKRILEYFDLSRYFDFVGGSTLDHTRGSKTAVIRYVLDEYSVSDYDAAVMIGDREHDIIGANQCGIDSIGVLYGYGCRREFEINHAAGIAENITELKKILLSR